MIDRFADLQLFILIVERGSLTAAARELGLSQGAVSLRLAALEKSAEAQLLRRSTRRLQLTEAGDQFYRTAKRVLAEMDDLRGLLSGDQGALKGQVRISAPIDLGRRYVAPAMDAYMRDNPRLSVSLLFSDTMLDLNENGIDIAIRYGRLPDSALRIRRISSNRRLPVAAPAYLDRVGRPQKPDDLRALNCMTLYRGGGRFDLWPFLVDGAATTVKVTGDRDANDGGLLRDWAIEGKGVVLKSAWDVADDIKAGHLEAILAPYCAADVDLQIVMPPSRQRPHRVTALADYCTTMLRRLDACLNELGIGSMDLSGHVQGATAEGDPWITPLAGQAGAGRAS
ncbi:LysR family transcriptional regulator [Parvibaculum sedimenti]|uniref:LysR family transcriptional regulator n=1 Tax=Parvibaculum sedimenti TaxID=2608632 RepID=A0A6N6VLA2_9HYPH|nr:LysR family transcriptional regulator [Parvibaculum sedimenti]KAB7740198.1 LysR family transcriptional regulator [Parvibaculum sedimenti]